MPKGLVAAGRWLPGEQSGNVSQGCASLGAQAPRRRSTTYRPRSRWGRSVTAATAADPLPRLAHCCWQALEVIHVVGYEPAEAYQALGLRRYYPRRGGRTGRNRTDPGPCGPAALRPAGQPAGAGPGAHVPVRCRCPTGSRPAGQGRPRSGTADGPCRGAFQT